MYKLVPKILDLYSGKFEKLWSKCWTFGGDFKIWGIFEEKWKVWGTCTVGESMTALEGKNR